MLSKLGVKHITVTINAVEPCVGMKINRYCIINGFRVHGYEGNDILIKNQLTGLEHAVQLGIVVKVNTVLIPDINSDHIKEIAYAIKNRGAHIMNIMPLIPVGRFRFLRRPSCEELRDARDVCEDIITQFRLCKQCRADACGIPGYD
jgi:nitrogen fixation protein NifB